MKLRAMTQVLVTTLIFSIAFPPGLFAQDAAIDGDQPVPAVETEADFSSFNDTDAQVTRIEDQVMKDLGCSLKKQRMATPVAPSSPATPEGTPPSAADLGQQNYQATVNQERLTLLSERIAKLEPAVYSRVLIRLAKCYVDKPASRGGIESVFNGVYGNVKTELEIEHLEDVVIKDTKTIFWVAAAFVTFLVVRRGVNAARTAVASGETGFAAFSRNFGRAFVRGLRPGMTGSQTANVSQQLKNAEVAVGDLLATEVATMKATKESLEHALESAANAELNAAKAAAAAEGEQAATLWGRVQGFWKNFKLPFSGGMDRTLRYWEGALDSWRAQATAGAEKIAKQYADASVKYLEEVAAAKAAARDPVAAVPPAPTFQDIERILPHPTPSMPTPNSKYAVFIQKSSEDGTRLLDLEIRASRATGRFRDGPMTPERLFSALAPEGSAFTRENLEKAVLEHLKKNINNVNAYAIEGRELLQKQLDEVMNRLEAAGDARLSGNDFQVKQWLRNEGLLPANDAATAATTSAVRKLITTHVTGNRLAIAGLGAFYGHHVYTLMTKRRIDPRPILAGAKIGVINSAALTTDLIGNFADEIYRVLGTRNPEATVDELKNQVLAITHEPQFELLRSHGHLSALPEGLETKSLTEVATSLESYFKENIDRIEEELKSVSDVTALQPAGDSVTRKTLEADQDGSELLWGLSAPPSVTLARLGAVRLTLEEVNRLLEEIQTIIPQTGEKK